MHDAKHVTLILCIFDNMQFHLVCMHRCIHGVCTCTHTNAHRVPQHMSVWVNTPKHGDLIRFFTTFMDCCSLYSNYPADGGKAPWYQTDISTLFIQGNRRTRGLTVHPVKIGPRQETVQFYLRSKDNRQQKLMLAPGLGKEGVESSTETTGIQNITFFFPERSLLLPVLLRIIFI